MSHSKVKCLTRYNRVAEIILKLIALRTAGVLLVILPAKTTEPSQEKPGYLFASLT